MAMKTAGNPIEKMKQFNDDDEDRSGFRKLSFSGFYSLMKRKYRNSICRFDCVSWFPLH